MVEKYIQMHGAVDGLDYAILRVANPFGPGQLFRKGQGLVPALLERLQWNEPIRIIGNGSSRRDFVFIDDVVSAIVASVSKAGRIGAVLNIGSGESRSVTEVVNTIERVTGHVFQKEYVPARMTDVDNSCLDISRAKEVLDWSPKVEFEAGILKTIGGKSQGQRQG
jgi:UDP-glucose 4-epimerase